MWKRILLILLGLVVLTLGGGLGFLYLRQPARAVPRAVKVEATPERLARGKYLFENLGDCGGCHSQRDFSRFGGPEVGSGRGRGSVFPAEMGLPGKIVAPNITPDPETGLGQWTDGEKIRAIREGISRDGRALFPMMPYTLYRQMSDEDVYALVAYLNSLPPVRHPLPRTEVAFPVSLFIKSAPQPTGFVQGPDRANKLAYGEYLVTLGGCTECHTPAERGQPIAGKRLAGGRVFRMGRGVVVSANITPDVETGIGRWSEQQFLSKFAEYKEYGVQGPPPAGPDAFTLMPWLGLAQLPQEDLSAIYAYLKSQAPVHNPVEVHPGHPNPRGKS